MKGEPGAIHLVDNNYDIENLDVDYDFQQFGDDQALMRFQPVSYCIKVCHKIGFYVQEIYQQQILRMNVEFYQDDNGKIYLFHASDIYVREAKKATRAQKKKMEEQQTSVKKKRVEKQSEEELEMEAVQKEVEDLLLSYKQMSRTENNIFVLNQIKRRARALMADLTHNTQAQEKSAQTIKVQATRKKLVDLMHQMLANLLKHHNIPQDDLNNSFETDHATFAASRALNPNCPLKLKQQVDLEIKRKGKMLTKNVFSE